MSRIHDADLEGSPKIRDPHHGGCNEWCYHKERFYIRHGISQWWTLVKKVSLTPQRIKALNSLLPEVLEHNKRIDEIRRSHG